MRPIAADVGFTQGMLDHFRKMGWSEEKIMQFWNDTVSKLKQSNPGEVNPIMKDLAKILPELTDEDIRNLLSEASDNATLQQSHLDHYNGAKQGLYELGSFWGELWDWSTLSAIFDMGAWVCIGGAALAAFHGNLPLAGALLFAAGSSGAGSAGTEILDAQERRQEGEITETQIYNYACLRIPTSVIPVVSDIVSLLVKVEHMPK
jgi:hypothetical protein